MERDGDTHVRGGGGDVNGDVNGEAGVRMPEWWVQRGGGLLQM